MTGYQLAIEYKAIHNARRSPDHRNRSVVSGLLGDTMLRWPSTSSPPRNFKSRLRLRPMHKEILVSMYLTQTLTECRDGYGVTSRRIVDRLHRRMKRQSKS
jgi:hypothetical protein